MIPQDSPLASTPQESMRTNCLAGRTFHQAIFESSTSTETGAESAPDTRDKLHLMRGSTRNQLHYLTYRRHGSKSSKPAVVASLAGLDVGTCAWSQR